MEHILTIYQFIDVGALVTLIFLVGGSYQRLKIIESFVRNHKAFHQRVMILESRSSETKHSIERIEHGLQQIEKRCFELHRSRRNSS